VRKEAIFCAPPPRISLPTISCVVTRPRGQVGEVEVGGGGRRRPAHPGRRTSAGARAPATDSQSVVVFAGASTLSLSLS